MKAKLDKSHYHIAHWTGVMNGVVWIVLGAGVHYHDWPVGVVLMILGGLAALLYFAAMVSGEK